MRLFEAIVEANHRATDGDAKAGLRPSEYEAALPVVALTCIDPRLNPLIPEVLGVPEEQFIWLRNAGNIITGPLSSTMRSLALACAVKGGKEIAVIGHSDCLVCKTSALQLTDRFAALGVPRSKLPDNLQEYFGLFASERQNVMRAVDFIRQSALIGPKAPVHGLLVDLQSGRLEWVVNGYQALETVTSAAAARVAAEGSAGGLGALPEFRIGDIKFPETKIGEAVATSSEPLKMQMTERAEPVSAKETPPPIEAAAESWQSWPGLLRGIDPNAVFKIVGEDRKIYGPVTVRDIEAWLREGRIDLKTLVQRVGYKDWKQLAAFVKAHVAEKLPTPPAIPTLKLKREKRN